MERCNKRNKHIFREHANLPSQRIIIVLSAHADKWYNYYYFVEIKPENELFLFWERTIYKLDVLAASYFATYLLKNLARTPDKICKFSRTQWLLGHDEPRVRVYGVRW